MGVARRAVTSCVGVLALAAVMPGVASAARGAGRALRIDVVSDRADLISGRDALVSIGVPPGLDPSAVSVELGGSDVTSEFAVRENGRFEGLLTGLEIGQNELTATAPGYASDDVTITDHSNGGPVFSGPQVKPWVCQNDSTSPKCAAPT